VRLDHAFRVEGLRVRAEHVRRDEYAHFRGHVLGGHGLAYLKVLLQVEELGGERRASRWRELATVRRIDGTLVAPLLYEAVDPGFPFVLFEELGPDSTATASLVFDVGRASAPMELQLLDGATWRIGE
jgi:hypothetical protein